MFSGAEIRMLRLRLGWTHADLARRLSCEPEVVRTWEYGERTPDPEYFNQLQYLSFKADVVAAEVAQKPLVDLCMRSLKLDQISEDQWKSVAPIQIPDIEV